jgi:hypothetical protein
MGGVLANPFSRPKATFLDVKVTKRVNANIHLVTDFVLKP